MSVNKKIIVSVILILLSSLSGCALFSRTEFSLISAVVDDDSGFPSIQISFNTTDKITLTLINPNSEILFSDIYYRAWYFRNWFVYLDSFKKKK